LEEDLSNQHFRASTEDLRDYSIRKVRLGFPKMWIYV